MSDEQLRPAQGRSSDRRRGAVPVWWGQLERTDLPDPEWGGAVLEAEQWLPRSVPPMVVEDDALEPTSRLHQWALSLLVVAVAAAIVVLGLGATSLRGVALALLLVGVPITLSVIAVTIVNRRA